MKTFDHNWLIILLSKHNSNKYKKEMQYMNRQEKFTNGKY